ncbi:MAG: hypothetical protein WC347_06080 [Smithellaceae bacterium]|jgi:hypothetical protein
MGKNELNKVLAAILTTALETEPASFPESFAYMACGANLDKWTITKAVLITGNLTTMEGNDIKLTEKGREMAKLINSALINKTALKGENQI